MESVAYQRIMELCRDRGITVTKLAEDVGLSDSLIRKWKSAGSPSISKIRKIAEYFGVSVDYLIGMSDIPDSAEKLMGDHEIISLQRARSKMTQTDRDRMMAMLRLAFDKAFED